MKESVVTVLKARIVADDFSTSFEWYFMVMIRK
jgi:hypothetical protein